MTVSLRRLCLAIAALAIAGMILWEPVSSAQKAAARSPEPSAGKGTIYIGTYPNQFWIVDEASAKVVGSIPFKSGIPRRTSLSRDRTRFYTIEAQMEKVEIIDIAARKTIDQFTLSEPNKHVRIRSLEPDPKHRFLIMVTKTATKLSDRWEVGATTILQYDLASHSITRTIPWPNNDERENANIQFSPDGAYMYLFSDQDVLIYETTSFRQIDKWEMSKPVEDGFGRLDFGQTDAYNDDPGFYTGLFTVRDPVQNRGIMGIGRVNLTARSVEFYTLGPATPVGFTMAPGRKVAYGLYQDIGRFEFWKFDLAGRKFVSRTEFAGRPRMSLKTSSNGQVLYIYNAGATIDLYDAATYKFMKAIQLAGDATTEMFVFPPAQAGTR